MIHFLIFTSGWPRSALFAKMPPAPEASEAFDSREGGARADATRAPPRFAGEGGGADAGVFFPATILPGDRGSGDVGLTPSGDNVPERSLVRPA